MVLQAKPNKMDENTLPRGTLALPKFHSLANRSQQAQIVKGKSPKGSDQPDAHYSTRYKPYTNPPETYINKPKHLEELSPASSKQLDVNSMPWHPSTHIFSSSSMQRNKYTHILEK